MKGFIKNNGVYFFTFFTALGAFAGILLPSQDILLIQSIRIVFGSIFILLLPGFFLTQTFFHEAEIDMLEKFVLSFALSISVVPLLTFYANLAGMPISAINVFFLALGIIIGASIYNIFFKKTPKTGISRAIQAE